LDTMGLAKHNAVMLLHIAAFDALGVVGGELKRRDLPAHEIVVGRDQTLRVLEHHNKAGLHAKHTVDVFQHLNPARARQNLLSRSVELPQMQYPRTAGGQEPLAGVIEIEVGEVRLRAKAERIRNRLNITTPERVNRGARLAPAWLRRARL